jgi:RimJ/RimL family protein N-acetyltransferase
LIGDDRVMAMITGKGLSRDEAKARFERLLGYNQLHAHLGAFKILDAETAEFIGLAKLVIKSAGDEEAELGYAIRPDFWGRRVATKAVKMLLETARSQSAVRMLYANIDPGNLASRKILVNNGFVTRAFKDFDGLPGEVLELRL